MYAEKNVSHSYFFSHELQWTGLASKSGLIGVGVRHIPGMPKNVYTFYVITFRSLIELR
jgi:hypothetical protein